MKDPRTFGTKADPIRCSKTPGLLRCPLQAMLLHLGQFDDKSRQAADTGDAIHVAVQKWHELARADEALAYMRRAHPNTFPLADIAEAEKVFQAYITDPRNPPEATFKVEFPVELSIPCHDLDATKQPIVIVGTGDQLRRDRGVLKYWDVKTGEPEAWDMLHDYALQLSAYCVAGTQTLGEPVHPGGIIRTKTYRKRGVKPGSAIDGVFINVPWTLEDCRLLLESIRLDVAVIRSGELIPRPGKHCGYCPAKSMPNCLAKMKRLMT